VINLETIVKVKEESNNSPSRMVKFDMPSFDSQTSEELPSITIDLYDVQESSIEEQNQQKQKVIFSDKCIETEELFDTNVKNIMVEEDIFQKLFSDTNMNELDKNVMIETLKDIFKILSGFKTEEVKPEDVSKERLSYTKVENLAKLESVLRMNSNINKKLIEERFNHGSDIEEIDEDNINEQGVQTHTLVLENMDLSLLDNLKDQNGCSIKQSAETSNKNEEIHMKDRNLKLKPIIPNSTILNLKNARKFPSCPELIRRDVIEYSNKAFAQTFVNHCEDDTEDLGSSEGSILTLSLLFFFFQF